MRSGFGKQLSAGALWVLLEQGPKHGLLDFREFSTFKKRWT
jgi:hypothetical protein